ncbi:MAG: dUTP diphosphatase [Thermodesulfobacteriota bacterium]|nr:MAG: dUTP diphosphatase [Thermodesulfobacteriota bacterium]
MEKAPLTVRIRLLSASAKAPCKSHDGDAGWDLFASEEATIPPGGTMIIKTGIAMQIPHGWYGQIKSRSGLGAKGLIVTAGVVDSSYRGEIGVVAINGNSAPDGPAFAFRPGDKVAQMVFLPVPQVAIELAEDLSTSTRGENGFGSTGR